MTTMTQPAPDTTDTLASQWQHLSLAQSTQRILGVGVSDQEYPGGKRRASRLMVLEDGRRVIATRRHSEERLRRERIILEAMTHAGCSTPALLGHNNWNILIQEEIQGQRLSRALIDANDTRRETILDAALAALAEAQQAGSAGGLDTQFPVLGNTEEWLHDFIHQPGRLGRFFDLRPKRPDINALISQLTVKTPRFVKWDARPGNAMLTPADRVAWFDWEHAASRSRLDDVAWLLGDEFAPDHLAYEDKLIARWLPEFADGKSSDEAENYLMTYATLHQMVRLALIIQTRKDGDWWNLDYCVAHDKVGVVLECAQTLCRRAARWSMRTDHLALWSPWFGELAAAIECDIPIPELDPAL